MIRAELKAQRELELARLNKAHQQKKARQHEWTREEARRSLTGLTVRIQQSLDRDAKKQAESDLKIFRDVARIRNPGKVSLQVQICSNWAKWKKQEIEEEGKRKRKRTGLFQLRNSTQRRRGAAKQGMGQSQSTTMSLASAALPKPKQQSPNNETGQCQPNLNLNSIAARSTVKRKKIPKVNDNDRKLEACQRMALLAPEDEAEALARKWARMPVMLKDALQREEKESIRFQTRLSTMKQQQHFHLRTQVSEEHLRTTGARLKELSQRREATADGYLARNSSQSDDIGKLNPEVTFIEPEAVRHNDASEAVFLHSQNESLERLVKNEDGKVHVQQSDPVLDGTQKAREQLGSPSTEVRPKSLGRSMNVRARPLSSKVRDNEPQRYEPADNPTAGKGPANRYAPAKKLDQGDNSRRSLFDPGHQFDDLDEQRNKLFSRTGVTTVKGFNESRENQFISRKEITIQNEEGGGRTSTRQIVSKCRTKTRIAHGNVLKFSKPRGSGLDMGYTTDLTTSRGRSERKRLSGTATGTQLSNKMMRYQSTSEIGGVHYNQQSLSQQKHAQQTPVIHTVDHTEGLKLSTLIEARNQQIETLPAASLSFSHARTAQQYPKDRAVSKQQLSSLRPISAQPFIKSRAYIIKDAASKNRLVTEEGPDTITSAARDRGSQAEVYHRLAARTKFVFERGLTGDRQGASVHEAARPALDGLQERHPSQFTIMSRTQAPFGTSRRGSVFTAKARNTGREQRIDSGSRNAALSSQERQSLIQDLRIQLSDLQAMNKLYKQQLHKQRQSRRTADRSSVLQTTLSSQQPDNPAESTQASFDLQELFFDCAYEALRLRNKKLSKMHGQTMGRKSGLARTNASQRAARDAQTVEEKTNTLLNFVTNRHVLQILYDVMFRFQKVQSKAFHDDQGCLSSEFMQELLDLKDGTASALQSRKTSLPMASTVTSKAPPRGSRNDPSGIHSQLPAFTEWNVSNLDQSEQFTPYCTIPQTTLSRDEARRLALVKLSKKQKQDMRNMKNQLVRMQRSQQPQRLQSQCVTAMGPSNGPSDGTLGIDSNSQTQPENLVRNTSDVSRAQAHPPSNPQSREGGASGPLPTDEAAVIQNIQCEEATDADEEAYAAVQDLLLIRPIDSFSGELGPGEVHDSEGLDMNRFYHPSDATDKRYQILSMNVSNNSALDPSQSLQFRMPNRFEQVLPIEVQINKNAEDKQAQRKKGNHYGGQGRTVKASVVTEKHGQDSDVSHDRAFSRASSKAKGSAERRYRGKRPRTIDSKKRSSNLKDHIHYEQTIKQNVELSRQRQVAIMNALAAQGKTPEGAPGDLPELEEREVPAPPFRPRSQKSSATGERPRIEGQAPQQSATLDVGEQRPGSRHASKVSLEAEPNNSSSQNENNRMKRRSIQLNISNKNARLSIQNKDQSLSQSREAHVSKSNEEVLELTGQLSPGPALAPKPESITMVDAQLHPASPPQADEPLLPAYTQASQDEQLNLDLALDAEPRDDDDRKALQIQAKEATLYMSQRLLATSLDDRPYRSLQESVGLGGADHRSSQPKLDESKEYTDLRHQTQDPSELGDHREPNQTSLMQQQVAPISSVHIANAPPIQAKQAEVSPVLSERSRPLPHPPSFREASPPRPANGNQTLNTISVRNVEQPTAQQSVYVVNQYESQFDEITSDDLRRPQQATIISSANLHDLAQFRVPTPPSSNISWAKGTSKSGTRLSRARPSAKQVDMLQNLKKVDKKVREAQASAKGGRRRK